MNERVASLRVNGVDITRHVVAIEFRPGDRIQGLVVGETRAELCAVKVKRTAEGYDVRVDSLDESSMVVTEGWLTAAEARRRANIQPGLIGAVEPEDEEPIIP